MAAVRSLQYCQNIKRLFLSPISSTRFISTSKKSQETATVADVDDKTECKTVKKNWVSYGFDFKDETEDHNIVHSTLFFSITCCIVFGGFIFAYMPDMKLRDWAQREAFIEIRRREKLGLPHVDPNLVDPSTIELPSDEELDSTEIII